MLRPADDAFLEGLARLLPQDRLMLSEPRHLVDPRGRTSGRAGPVAAPRSTDEVATIVRACAAAHVGLLPWGGGTGLVLGQIMPDGPMPLILSLGRMAKVRSVHPEENALVVEAGAILADVHAAAESVGRIFPLSLASEGSAQIGGLMSTNAGGINVLRYGNTRDLVLGIEAVLPDGSVLHDLKRLRKDNTGYDLRHLLIGAEGTLGIITAAALRLHPRPAGEGTAMISVAGPRAALALLALANDRFGGCVSAFELIHRQGAAFLTETMPEYRQPWPEPPEWVVLIEVGMPLGLGPTEALEGLFAAALAAGLSDDGLIAQNRAQRAAFWEYRERLPEANRRVGSVSSHDISLPLGEIPAFMERGPKAVAALGDFRINVFGHLGDGNLHWNVFPPKGIATTDLRHRANDVKQVVHDLVTAMGGSISAEHGIGRLKVDDLARYADPAKMAAMRTIKAALDPVGIMNPGAVLRG